jgi:hypothetical protein
VQYSQAPPSQMSYTCVRQYGGTVCARPDGPSGASACMQSGCVGGLRWTPAGIYVDASAAMLPCMQRCGVEIVLLLSAGPDKGPYMLVVMACFSG